MADGKEISEEVARQMVQQAAQQAAEQVAQAISQTIQKTIQTGVSSESKQEEIMGGEAIRSDVVRDAGMRGLNSKLHLDDHVEALRQLHEDSRIELKEERSYIAELRQDARQQLALVNTYQNGLLKGLVTSDSLITKQAIAHRDVAVDSTWDPGPGEESVAEAKK
jgi:hypothetical protein